MKDSLSLNPVFSGLAPSSTLYVNETVNKLWQQGEQVFHMGFGESRFDVNPRLQKALATHSDKKSYLPARGLPELTQAVAEYYSEKLSLNYSPSQVLIGPGSKSLIFGLQMVIDADVFLPTPSWVSYGPQATLLANKFSYIPSKVEDNYQLDINELDRLVKASHNPCKMLLINSPNNPTGNMMSETFVKELAEYCRAQEIWVLSDEIYFEVCHGDTPHVSIAKYYPEGTFVLGGLSKHFSIGGWRLGAALLPDSEEGRLLMQKMVVLASETWSGVSAPVQYAAIEAYRMHQNIEQYVADCTAIHGIRTRFFREGLMRLDIHCSSGEGAFYLMPNFDRWREELRSVGVSTSSDLARVLLEKYRIATLPGSDFGVPESTLSLRLSTSYLDMETDNRPSEIFHLYQSQIGDKSLMSDECHPMMHAALDAFEQFLEDLSDR